MASAVETFIFRVEEAASRTGESSFSGAAVSLGSNPFVAASVMVANELRSLYRGLQQFASSIERVSPSISRERGLAEVRQLNADIYADRTVGRELAEMVKLESEIYAELTKIRADIYKHLVPFINECLKVLRDMLQEGRSWVDAWTEFDHGFQVKIAQIIFWITAASPEQQQKILNEIAEAHRRSDRKAEERMVVGLPGFFRLFPLEDIQPVVPIPGRFPFGVGINL